MDDEYTITEHDAETGETTTRPMTDEERGAYDAYKESANQL